MAQDLSLQTGSSVWYGPEIKERDSDWVFQLSSVELKELEAAVDLLLAEAASIASFLPLDLVDSLDKFYLPNLTKRINSFLQQLTDGLGFLVCRGFPIETWSHEQKCTAFLLIGRLMGNLRQQNSMGHVLGHVKDLGVSSSDPSIRIYQTNERQPFHCDVCDVVGLFCLQKAKSGGLSALISSSTVFNEMLKTDRGLAEELFNPLPFDRRGEVLKGMKPYWEMPVFNKNPEDGTISTFYIPYISSSQRLPDAPRLTKMQIKALDLFNKLNDDPRLHFEMELEPGDMQFVNNHVILHSRSGFEDWPDVGRGRHLLRVWIAPEKARCLPDVYTQVYGSLSVGKRGGWAVPGIVSVAPLNPE